MIEYIWRIDNFDVFYTNKTNGGGDYFALEYIDITKEWYTSVDHVLEWCSGPGFIGFGMLASGLAKNVTLSDMYLPAIELAQHTKENNPTFADNINVVQGKSLENVEGTFDLIVANPPHWPSSEAAANTLGFDSTQFEHIEDILVDPNWHSHKEFFIKAKSLLATNGRILLQENYTGSTPENFRLMVQQAGLKISTYTKSEMYNDIYYLEVIHEQRL
jgi:methylase of polypeptide subunit release factors